VITAIGILFAALGVAIFFVLMWKSILHEPRRWTAEDLARRHEESARRRRNA